MRIVERSDGFMLNLDAAVSFKPVRGDMIVEFPGPEFYIITDFKKNDLFVALRLYREFKGWPE